jgi:DNA-binding response OmpR family regulator
MPKRILIVDDEEDVCEFMRNFFRKRKYDVLTARNGEEAISLYQEKKPDLVLLDIKMEGMDGVQVLERLKNTDPQARVIMVSGQEDEVVIEKTKKLGALDYVHKPLQLEEIDRVVIELLRKD